MEKMRHFLGSRSAVGTMPAPPPPPPPPPPTTAESRSIFRVDGGGGGCDSELGQEMRDCYQGLEEFRSALRNLDGAGTLLTESLTRALRGTRYQRVGEQLAGSFREVYGSQGSLRFLEQLKEMEAMLLGAEFPREGGGQEEELRAVYAQVSGCRAFKKNKLKTNLQFCAMPILRFLPE